MRSRYFLSHCWTSSRCIIVVIIELCVLCLLCVRQLNPSGKIMPNEKDLLEIGRKKKKMQRAAYMAGLRKRVRSCKIMRSRQQSITAAGDGGQSSWSSSPAGSSNESDRDFDKEEEGEIFQENFMVQLSGASGLSKLVGATLLPTGRYILRNEAPKYYNRFFPKNARSLFTIPLGETVWNMKVDYPDARRDDSAIDDYHGNKIADPYRWLEDPDSPETAKFVEQQNSITKPFLECCRQREDINARLTQLWNFPKYSCPTKHGERYFFYQNTGLQNQSVLYVQNTSVSKPRVFLDPNQLSTDGTVALSGTAFSEDGATFAYGLSKSGSDWITFNFMNVQTGEKYPDVLEKAKFTSLSWTHDHKGVFYGRYPDQSGKTDGSETNMNLYQKLYYHRLDTPQSEDVLVVEFPEEPSFRIGATVSDCGKYLIVMPQKDCRDNLLYFCNISALPDGKITGKLELTQIVSKLEADYEYVTNEGEEFIFRTNKNAPNYRLIKINLSNFAEENWKVLIEQHERNVLDWAAPVGGDKLVTCYIQDVKSVLELRELATGELLKTFPLAVGTIVGFSGEKKHSEIFYLFTSFLTPGIIYRYDVAVPDQEPTITREIKLEDFDFTQYETKQVFYKSKDSTEIPMFIVHKKGLPLNGTNPCLLYGYGGFNISVQPTFSVTRLVFIQHFNGVLAIPNIRGGGEYGEAWHNAGRLLNKQNVFDDFQMAAEYLIEQKYTRASKLTIQGGSNGGLLVAACINQRPELFGAAIAQVGVLDMLRFHKFTIGFAWVSDYGCSDDKIHYENLIKYSPLHNIKAPVDMEKQYPSTLLFTADHDDRVVPLHSLKFIATLQHTLKNCSSQLNPTLIRVETKAGHGGGKPTTKMIEENTDLLCFLVQTIGIVFKK